MEENKQQLLTPILRWFMFAMVLANIASGMQGMLMPLYLTELGASVAQIGLVFTIMSVVILFLQLLGGWISDSIGRLKAIAIGSIGGVFGLFFIALAPTWQWLLVAMCFSQIPYALVGPSFGAFIAENSTEENRGKVYGVTDTLFQITGVLGPPLGGFLADTYNFKVMLLVSASFYTLAAGLRIWMATTMTTPEDVGSGDFSASSFFGNMKTIFAMIFGGGVLTWIFISDGVRDIAFRMSGELQPLYLEQFGGLDYTQIGILGSIFSISMMLTPFISGWLSDRKGERLPISLGFLIVFSAFFIFLNTYVFAGFAASWVVFGLGVGLLSPAYQSLISKVVPKELLGTFNGLFYSSLGVISLAAPWVGAQIWEHYNPRLPFIITAAAVLVSVPVIWLKFRAPDKPDDIEAEPLAA